MLVLPSVMIVNFIFLQRQIGFHGDGKPVLYMNLAQGKEDFTSPCWKEHLTNTVEQAVNESGSPKQKNILILMDTYGKIYRKLGILRYCLL